MPYTDLSTRVTRLAEGFYTSEVRLARPHPVRTFLPTGYEPNYAYPLLVLLHGQGGNEEQILRLAPKLSRRNYISISLRGPVSMGVRRDGSMGFSWGRLEKTSAQLEDYVVKAVEQTRRSYHIHSERIFLAGFGEGATLAYRLGLAQPEKFGGLVSLNGSMPPYGGLMLRLDAVRQLKAFIGHGIANAIVPYSLARNDFRLLYTAGLDVTLRRYPTTHRLHADMLRDLNRWVIESCTGEKQ